MTVNRDNRWKAGGKRERDWYPILDRERKQPIPYDKLHDWLVDSANRARLEDHLDWYLRIDNNYAGRQFEWFASQANGSRFTSFHILAAESLSVKVPSTAARWLLEPDRNRDSFLESIHQSLTPGADTLWSCEVSLLQGDKKNLDTSGAMYRLFYLLKDHGIGPVTSTKLLASMFPFVIPIQDSRLTSLILPKAGENWWLIIRKLFAKTDGELEKYLDELSIPIGSENITTLRRLDIILWMEANARRISSK